MLYNITKPKDGENMPLPGRGRLITLEGIDGTGKTTQIASLSASLRERGISVLELREPGGTAIGEAIRQILLDNKHSGMSDETELLLFTAARAQSVREIMLPALANGTWIICDRFLDSTLAYQGYGRGMDLATINSINGFAVDGCRPDITILLDLPVETAVSRMGSRQTKADRLDGESRAFMQRTRDGYLAAAAHEPNRIIVINAEQSAADLAINIFNIIWEGLGI